MLEEAFIIIVDFFEKLYDGLRDQNFTIYPAREWDSLGKTNSRFQSLEHMV